MIREIIRMNKGLCNSSTKGCGGKCGARIENFDATAVFIGSQHIDWSETSQ